MILDFLVSKIKNIFKKLRRSKYLNVILLPDGKEGVRFKISLKLAYFLTFLIGLFLLVVVVLVISYAKVSYKALQAKSLALENRRLSEYNVKVTELEGQLKAYRSFIQKIGKLAGVEYSTKIEPKIDYKEDLYTMSEITTSDSESFNNRPSFPFQLPKSRINPFFEDFIPGGFPVEGWITKGFVEKKEKLGVEHPGVDIACKEGTEVKATASGWVKFAGWDPEYGNLLILEHQEGYSTFYGHNKKLKVLEGEFVEREKVIALSGNTGKSTAPHLHYEIRKDGVPVDPKNFLIREGKDEK